MNSNRFAGAGTGGGGYSIEHGVSYAKFRRNRLQPSRRAFFAKRERCRQSPRAATHERFAGVGQERLGQREYGVRPNAGHIAHTASRQAAYRAYAHRGKQSQCLIFNHIRQRTNHKQFARIRCGQGGHHRGKAGILALGKCCLDSRPGIAVDPHMRAVQAGQAFRRATQIQLDHL